MIEFKIFQSSNPAKFQNDLKAWINSNANQEDFSFDIQYSTCINNNGEVVHSALIMFQQPEVKMQINNPKNK